MNISRGNGFTLVEILVATLILATVLTTIYAAYTGTFKLEKNVRSSDDIYGMARTAFSRMTEDIECARGYKNSFKFVSGEFGTEDFMELSFLSSSHLNFGDERSSGIAMIRYYIIKDTDGDNYSLKRMDELYRGEAIESEDRGYILCTGLRSLAYTFYDRNGTESDSWDSESPLTSQSSKLPSVVLIKMNFTDPGDTDNPYRFMTKISLPMGKNP